MSGWAATSANVAGPVTGFIFDGGAGAIRPMLGIPGAAYLGPPVVSGLAAGFVSPDGSAVLGVEQSGRLVLYMGLRGSTAPVGAPIKGGIPGVDRFAWAADSKSAAVYASKSGQAQMLTNLTQPTAGEVVTGLPGTVTGLAWDGQRIIFAITSPDSGGIYIAGSQVSVQRIATGVNPSALALSGADLFFADGQSGEVWEVKGYAGTPAAVLFASDASISATVGLGVSADGSRLYAANAGSKKVTVYDVASRAAVESIDLNFTPARLDQFGNSSVFLLNSGGQGPVYVLSDGGGQKPAVFFVPAPGGRRESRTHTME
jgi:hypothetical protein